MNRIALTAALFATTLAGSAVARPESPANERRFDVDRFAAIDLAGSDNVRVVSGTAISVVASGDPRAVAALAIEVRGDTLRVGRKPGNWRDKGAIVSVTIPTLRAATISGSGSLRAIAIRVPAFIGRISGSGGMSLTSLRAGDARFDLSGSGSIVADGSADRVSIDLGGSGRVDTRHLAAADVTVTMGGSGSITATASRTADVRAGGSGSVAVSGGPTCTVRGTGTAVVRCG
jgi:hypothetical protein